MRTETKSVRNGLRLEGDADNNTADMPGEDSVLLSIPRLGPVRAKALAAVGITSLDDLRRISQDDLAKIKYVGSGNARLIKDWLATQGETPNSKQSARRAPATSRRTAKSTEVSLPATSTVDAKEATDGRATRVNRRNTSPRKPAAKPAAMPASLPMETSVVVVKETPINNIGGLSAQVNRLKEALSDKARGKKLDRQLDKVLSTVSDGPASLDILSADDKANAAATIARIAKLLDKTAAKGKLSEKKQLEVADDLKSLRKRLEKTLGD